MGYGVLALIVVAALIVATMSAKTWQIYQVVLVAFVFLASVAFFYLAARTLATHKSWRILVESQKKEVQNLHQQLAQLRGGEAANGESIAGQIPQLKREVEKLALDRGGALFGVAVEGVKDGVVQLTFKSPEHGLVANTVLFAFDVKPFAEGGRYQGEFKVVSVGEDSAAVQIAPNLPLTEAQARRLAAAKGPWTFYTTMPIDDAAVFAILDEPARQALLPAQSLAEYGNAERKLRDYEFFFHENYVQRSLLTDGISKITGDLERIQAATQKATDEIAYRGTEKTNLQADLEKFQYEQKAIATYQQTLQQLFSQVRESLKATYARNKQLAADLTASQLKAADEINERTTSTQTGAKSNLPAAQPQ
jgi:hypothetical protein